MLPKELLQNLNIKDAKDLKMAQNLWKMLDQMAENKPDQYKEFVNKNITQGLQDIKTQKSKKQDILKVAPSAGFLIKMRASLNEIVLEKINEKFNLNLEHKEPWSQLKNKMQKQIKIYLNVCYSDRILLPLDEKNNEISVFNNVNISKIVTIPNSLQKPQTKINSVKEKVYYYVLVINDKVYENLKKMNYSYLVNLSVSLFQERLKADKNPLLQLYNPNTYLKLAYYNIQKLSIQVHKKKNFKVLKQLKPKPILFQMGADKNQSKDVNKSKPPPPTQIKFKNTQEQKNEEIKLPVPVFNKKEQQKMTKKNLIQEIDQKQDNKDNKIPYTLKKNEKQYEIEFLVFGVSSINDLQLDISTNCIKLNVKNTEKKIQLTLQKLINVDTVKAKLSKKEFKLKITLPFL